MAAGQPTKYDHIYCDQIVEFMSKGNSIIQFAASIGVHKDSIYEWAKVHDEFSVAFKKAQINCEAHWEKIVQAKTLKKIQGSDAVLIFYLKNRFKWTDKLQTESEIKVDHKITFTTQIGDEGEILRHESEDK